MGNKNIQSGGAMAGTNFFMCSCRPHKQLPKQPWAKGTWSVDRLLAGNLQVTDNKNRKCVRVPWEKLFRPDSKQEVQQNQTLNYPWKSVVKVFVKQLEAK